MPFRRLRGSILAVAPRPSSRTATILLVEDDDVDALAFQRGFRRLDLEQPIVRARDGVEALQILRGAAGQEPLPHPYVIVLDLNMPRLSGVEFLDRLREDPELRRSVVFVLTTSGGDDDRQAAYDRNVAAYIVKSDAASGFEEIVRLLDHYRRVVELP